MRQQLMLRILLIFTVKATNIDHFILKRWRSLLRVALATASTKCRGYEIDIYDNSQPSRGSSILGKLTNRGISIFSK